MLPSSLTQIDLSYLKDEPWPKPKHVEEAKRAIVEAKARRIDDVLKEIEARAPRPGEEGDSGGPAGGPGSAPPSPPFQPRVRRPQPSAS